MNKWWKNPVLQGPENDYGQYDYLIEDIPQDYAKWEYSKYASKCDCCGKERHLLFKTAHYFHTLDGYDYTNYDECWKCEFKDRMWSFKRKLKKKIKNSFGKRIQRIKDARMLARTSSAGNFRYYYKLLKGVYK